MLQRSLATESVATASPFLDWALTYARYGWFVFPCRAQGKTPLTTNGFKDASRSEAVIRAWWTQFPDANVAIATGQSKLLVIDIDPRHGGDVSLSALEDRCGPLVGKSVKTGGGGEHYYCKMPMVSIGSRANAFGDEYPGIDVRGTGGYVIAPPSVHPNGSTYDWDPGESALCRLGVSFTNMLAATATRKIPIPGIHNDLPILAGSRRAVMVRAAGKWRHDGMTEDAILMCLLAVNEKQCRPPLGIPEVEKVASEAGGWEPGDFLAGLAPDDDTRELPPLAVQLASEVTVEPVDYLWPTRMAFGAVTALIGPPEVGKTFLYCAIAAALSTGAKIPGMADGLKARSLIYHGEDSASTVVGRLERCSADLSQIVLVKQDVSRATVPAIDAFLDANPDVRFVVIDPVAVLLVGKDENRDTDVRDCLNPLAAMAERRNVVVMYLRHLSKDTSRSPMQRILGSGAFGAVPRSVLYLDEHKSTHRRAIFHIKNNLGEKDVPVEYFISDEGWMWGDESDDLDADGFSRSVVPLDVEEKKKVAKLPDAVAWLQRFLADGPYLVTEVERLMKIDGFTPKTIRNARGKVGAESEKAKGFQSRSFLYLPPILAPTVAPSDALLPLTQIEGQVWGKGKCQPQTCPENLHLPKVKYVPARVREEGESIAGATCADPDALLDYALDNLPPVSELFGAP